MAFQTLGALPRLTRLPICIDAFGILRGGLDWLARLLDQLRWLLVHTECRVPAQSRSRRVFDSMFSPVNPTCRAIKKVDELSIKGVWAAALVFRGL